MTEKEKMLAGEVYDANYDEQLIAERLVAAELCHDYNLLRPSDEAGKEAILTKLLGRKGKRCDIVQPFHCDYGYNIEVGDNFYANFNCVMLDGGGITFGDNVLIGPDCGFYTANHAIDAVERRKGLETAEAIHVGNDVWFGGGVRVLPGVTIGDDVVIGAGSVVTNDIPSHSVAVGNPCKVIRKL